MPSRKKSRGKQSSKTKTRPIAYISLPHEESQAVALPASVAFFIQTRVATVVRDVSDFIRTPLGWIPSFRNSGNVEGNSNNELSQISTERERENEENKHLNEIIMVLRDEIDQLKLSVKEKEDQIRIMQVQSQEGRQKIAELTSAKRKLIDEKHSFEKENEDALRRLSELVSVRLRDDNTNIVDLSDPFRPTKLAEMFSELYDNEWTTACAVLKGTFTETQAIVILLDMVMESYEFCEERMEEQLNLLEKWFLNSNLPGAQQTCKGLKDSRKASILDKLQEVATEFEGLLGKMCKDQAVKTFLSDSVVKSYITKCVELCLLMTTTDPPVIMGCPNWESSKKLSATEENKVNTDGEGKEDNRTVVKEQSHGEVSGTKEGKPYVRYLYGEQFDGDQETNKEPVVQKGPNDVIPTKRSPFEKETFNEYTVRGKYIDFIVWPALYLHKDGLLFAKGIAQGSKDEWDEKGNTNWTWRRKLSFNDE